MSEKVKQSVLLSAVNQYFALIIQFVMGMVIARLLTPAEIGVYSIGAVVIAIAHMFRDFGIGKYIINEKELSTKKLRAAFTLTLIISWSIAVLLFFTTPYIANFYKTEAISNIFHVVTFNFVLIPFGSTLMTYLKREWHFKAILVTGILSNLVQVIVTLVLAYQGYSYMSLAWGSIANVLVTIATLQLYRPKDFPVLPSIKGIKHVFQFGSFASIESIFKQAGNSSPDIFIGKSLTMADVGYFSKGYSIIQIFNFMVMKVIKPVALPYFSMIERGNNNLSEAYKKILNLITMSSLLFFAFIIVSAEPIILTLFGDQWVSAVQITQILAVGAAISSIVSFADLVLVARGKVRVLAMYTFIFQTVRIISIAVAATHSLTWVVIIFVLFKCMGAISYLAMLKRSLDMAICPLLKTYLINFLISVTSILPLVGVSYIIDIESLNNFSHLLLNASLWGAASLLLMVFSKHQLYQEVSIPARSYLKLKFGKL